MQHIVTILFGISLAVCSTTAAAGSRIENLQLVSKNFSANKIGISSTRKIQVYLPHDYDATAKRYPVVYFLHTFFEDEHTFFHHQKGRALLDQAIADGAIKSVIVVTADFNTPLGGSLYTNSPVTGNWSTFMIEELVPHIDKNYRTIATRHSRGIFGYQLGGYGAIRFASRHPETFGSVYALHPVATGLGNLLMQSRPNWEKLQTAKTLNDIKVDGFSQIFTAIYQANLPNPNRPPLYFDPPARLENGKLIIDSRVTEKLQQGFFLEREIPIYADNLKSLIGFKFDWGRHDFNQDHVYANQFYSRKLNEFGITHEAEEYNGGWGDRTFDKDGRIYTSALPFFKKHLTFE